MPTTHYVWDEVGENVIAEYEDGVLTAAYTYEAGRHGNLISQRRSGTTHYHHFDAMGNTVALTDDSGAVTDTYVYDAWGNLVDKSGSSKNPFRWGGRDGYYTDDSTGTISVRARVYEPVAARWSSVDPLWELALVLFYVYAKNSPVVRHDPSGLLCSVATGCGTPTGQVLRNLAHGNIFASSILPFTSRAASGSHCDQRSCQDARDKLSERIDQIWAEHGVYYVIDETTGKAVKRACPKPHMKCCRRDEIIRVPGATGECDGCDRESTGGYITYPTQVTDAILIRICADNTPQGVDSEVWFEEVILHELSHAITTCQKQWTEGSPPDCEDLICDEIRAYVRSGGCPSKKYPELEKCLEERARGSARRHDVCLGLSNQKFEAMLARLVRDEFCTKPIPIFREPPREAPK